MQLGELQARLGGQVLGAWNPSLQRVRLDSREVKQGDLFAALPGTQVDGSRFVNDAIQRGAAALLMPCLLYTSPSPRDRTRSRMPSSA